MNDRHCNGQRRPLPSDHGQAKATNRQAFADASSPVAHFLRECCRLAENSTIPKVRLFNAWSLWCTQNGRNTGSANHFARELLNAAPSVERSRPSRQGHRMQMWQGLELLTEEEPGGTSR